MGEKDRGGCIFIETTTDFDNSIINYWKALVSVKQILVMEEIFLVKLLFPLERDSSKRQSITTWMRSNHDRRWGVYNHPIFGWMDVCVLESFYESHLGKSTNTWKTQHALWHPLFSRTGKNFFMLTKLYYVCL